MSDLLKTGRLAQLHGWLRHYGGFVLAGVLALVTDATALEVLTSFGGMDPFIGRLFSIAIAVVVSWWVNRTVTFRMVGRPTIVEFMRFATVAWTAQGVNYLIYAAILLAVPGTRPLVALILACFVSMFVSYTGYKFGVFRRRSD